MRTFSALRQRPLAASLALFGCGALLLFLAFLADRPDRAAGFHFPLPQLDIRASFPKWGGVLDRDWAKAEGADAICRERMGQPCNLTTWRRYLDSIRGLPFLERVAAVNSFVNAYDYEEDDDNWGASDYWAAPGEFFAKNGDCEDFAIAKYYSLRALGVPAERMRIVVLQDRSRRIPHAVLTVRWVGPDLILDNLSPDLRVWDQVPHYTPIYAINEADFEILRRPVFPNSIRTAGS